MRTKRNEGADLPPLPFLRFLVDEARARLRKAPDDETAARILADATDEARERFGIDLDDRAGR